MNIFVIILNIILRQVNSFLGHGQFVLAEYRWLVHIYPITEQFIGANELIVSVERLPVFLCVFIKEINPDTSFRPTFSLKILYSIKVSNEYSHDWIAIFIICYFILFPMIVNEVLRINLDVWVSDDRDSLLLLFDFIEELIETFEVVLIEYKVAPPVSVFNI